MTFKKRKIFMDYEKEEKWINQMAEKGYFLIKYTFGTYTFEEGEPGKYEYRIELLNEQPKSQNSQDYLTFMADSEIECVDTYYRWAFFRKRAADEPFKIYSDNKSRMQYINRVSKFILGVSLINLFFALFNSFMGSISARGATNLAVGIPNGLIFVAAFLIYLKYRKNLEALKEERYIHE